jgi:hypothetical protein
MAAASMPAARSCSAGVADPGIDLTASFAKRGGWPSLASAAKTASPSPPSGQWSSTVMTCPVSRAAQRSVALSMGLMEYASITRAGRPSLASCSAACIASATVIPAATMDNRSSGLAPMTRLPPMGNSSSGPYRTGVSPRVVRK